MLSFWGALLVSCGTNLVEKNTRNISKRYYWLDKNDHQYELIVTNITRNLGVD